MRLYCVYGDVREPTCIELTGALQEKRAYAALCDSQNGYIVMAASEERAIKTYQHLMRVVGASRHIED